MRRAIIRNGIVENIVVADADWRPGDGATVIDAVDREGNKARVGLAYRDGLFEQPVKPPEPEQRRYVPKSLIVRRLDAAGLLEAANAGLPQLPLIQQRLWDAHTDIWSEDPDTRAFLTAIGADPDAILAPGPPR